MKKILIALITIALFTQSPMKAHDELFRKLIEFGQPIVKAETSPTSDDTNTITDPDTLTEAQQEFKRKFMKIFTTMGYLLLTKFVTELLAIHTMDKPSTGGVALNAAASGISNMATLGLVVMGLKTVPLFNKDLKPEEKSYMEKRAAAICTAPTIYALINIFKNLQKFDSREAIAKYHSDEQAQKFLASKKNEQYLWLFLNCLAFGSAFGTSCYSALKRLKTKNKHSLMTPENEDLLNRVAMAFLAISESWRATTRLRLESATEMPK